MKLFFIISVIEREKENKKEILKTRDNLIYIQWIYDLYCSCPPGGNRDILASLWGNFTAFFIVLLFYYFYSFPNVRIHCFLFFPLSPSLNLMLITHLLVRFHFCLLHLHVSACLPTVPLCSLLNTKM